MFSLRSNSIESRFRSILWGCFYTDIGLQFKTAKKGQNKKMDSLRSLDLFSRHARSRL